MRLVLSKEEVAEEGPGHYEGEQRVDGGGGGYKFIQARVSLGIEFGVGQKQKERNEQKEERICMEGSGEISRKQCMHGSLASAAGAVVAGGKMKHAFGHPCALCRVEKCIDHGQKAHPYKNKDYGESSAPRH